MSKAKLIKMDNTKLVLEFEVWEPFRDDDNGTEVRLEASCYEDVENYFKLYFAKKWDELFEGKHVDDTPTHVEFRGIQFGGSGGDHKIHFVMYNQVSAAMSVNVDDLESESAQKLAKISELISNK